MAECLAVPGGIASFVQILDAVIKLVGVFSTFCRDMKDAPSEVKRIRDKLLLLQTSLESSQQCFADVDGDILLPPDLGLVLKNGILSVQTTIKELQHTFQRAMSANSMESIRRRLRWALLDRHAMDRALEHLRDSEETLTCSLQLLTL